LILASLAALAMADHPYPINEDIVADIK